MLKMLPVSTALVLTLTACGDDSSDDAVPTAQSAALVLQSEIPEITRLLEIDEDNDPNELIGRPNGYVGATVVFDSRVECPDDDPGVDCGATIEEWPSRKEAQERSDYIQSLQSGSSMLGSEWNTVRGKLLLRVTGNMKPSEAEGYAEIFESEDLAAEVDSAEADDSTPAATESDEQPSEPEDFVIESGFTTGTDSIGTRYTSAGARLTNANTDLAAYDVQVLFNLIGGNGEVIDTTTETVPYVGPGEAVPVAPLQIGFDLKAKPIDLQVQVVGEFSDDVGPKGPLSDKGVILQMEGVDVIKGDYGNEISGRVTNTTDEVVEWPSWSCIFLNGKKIVGGSSSTITDPIPPGSTVQFDDMLSIDGLLPKKVECRVLADLP
ncbi:hypothetical protein [Nocardioides sp. Root140]|uniref:hypothetical protein n=1 Tax=Nocardioides sp. Root140 TaxID=1736460 RepID=UPI0006FAA7EE|nr:hypothetical protein [Nocardioides sp. Root140]KQY62403.1 hypothetical protein ASD30_23810 [Nocardioides sp. Root140]